jgi:integral membrane protein (TIGR01906 family)
MTGLGGRLAAILVGLSTAVVIVTVAVLPFLTPQWVSFEQDRAEATAWTGFTQDELNAATGAVLSDLVFGPPDFDVSVRGEPVLDERERGHMRDVRTVFTGLWLLAAASAIVLVVAIARADRARVWRAVQAGAIGVAGAVVVLGVVALVAFDTLFELFHRLLFPAGSYTFDPGTERLVQLFPFRFWEETALVVGLVIVVLAALVAAGARRRAATARHRAVTVDLPAAASIR